MHPHKEIQRIEKSDQSYGFHFKGYQPHIYEITKDDIYLALLGLELGLQSAEELLKIHDRMTHRDTRYSQKMAEIYEGDIARIKSAIKSLKENPKKDISPKIV